MGLYLRQAERADKKLIFDWANEEETRKNSFSSEPILWEEHEKWYEDVIASEDTRLFVCMDFLKPVGQVRISKTETGEEKISYLVGKESRGNGLGKKMLLLLEEELRKRRKKEKEEAKKTVLYGEVKKENIASVKTFQGLGYTEVFPVGGSAEVCYFQKEIGEEGTSGKREDSMTKKKRRPEFEVLRVLSMVMVILLHYLSKGNLLTNFGVEYSGTNLGFWILEAACLVCVNVYVLISGYFLTEAPFRLSKLVRLWCQVLFYSIGVTLICMLTGIVNYRDYLDFYQLQFFCFPVINGHYWFGTAYILMYLFSPVLAHGVKKLEKKQLGGLILIILVPFCLVKSILPVPLSVDDLGNSFVWFLILYLIAAYIRLYGFPLLEKKTTAFMWYFFSVCGILVSVAAFGILHKNTAAYEHGMTIPDDYNFIFVLTGSLGLFMLFKEMRFRESRLTKYLTAIAPYTFGVYLLHEHLLLRYRWLEWLQVGKTYGGLRILHMLLVVLIVFCVGILVDFLRECLFRLAEKFIPMGLRIYFAKKEVFDYLIFGGLTTVVNWIVYIMFAYLFFVPIWETGSTTNVMAASVVAWVVSVLFAYVTNRNFVFHSSVSAWKERAREFVSFVAARIFSFFMELLLMYVMVDRLEINDLISKFVIGFVVVASNYIFSKLWIFKDGNKVE